MRMLSTFFQLPIRNWAAYGACVISYILRRSRHGLWLWCWQQSKTWAKW